MRGRYKIKEKNYENQIKRYLDDIGAWYVKIWGGGMQRAGIPDILACVNGYFVAIEVKSSTGVPSALQEYNVKKIKKANGYAIITYPEDFEQLKKDLSKLCNTHIQD